MSDSRWECSCTTGYVCDMHRRDTDEVGMQANDRLFAAAPPPGTPAREEPPSILRDASPEELREAALLIGNVRSYGKDYALAAKALRLIAEGRESGAFLMSILALTHRSRSMPETLRDSADVVALLGTLAGSDG